MTAREYMEKLHSMFEEADDADAQGAFMQAILMFTAAFICATEDKEVIDREAARYITALVNLIKIHNADLVKKQTGRFDA